MSLAEKIIRRLMITTLIGTCVAYGWLYAKALHVQTYLEQRALVQQAREISDFIVIGKDGVVVFQYTGRTISDRPNAKDILDEVKKLGSGDGGAKP